MDISDGQRPHPSMPSSLPATPDHIPELALGTVKRSGTDGPTCRNLFTGIAEVDQAVWKDRDNQCYPCHLCPHNRRRSEEKEMTGGLGEQKMKRWVEEIDLWDVPYFQLLSRKK